MIQREQKKDIRVIGGGLAGCEAALFLAERGFHVSLYDIKPDRFTVAHTSRELAELICSNSLRSDSLANAVGLLKAEMRMLGSAVIAAADQTRIPAGSALAVDRKRFSETLTRLIMNHPNITFISQEVTAFDPAASGVITILTPGPLVTDPLAEFIRKLTGADNLHFFDAIAPIVSRESIDESKTFMASRYGKGGDDYLNCPMDRETYEEFRKALATSEQAALSDFETGKTFFEGCLPVEEIARRGEDALCFGPLKPVGLDHPQTGQRFHAVVQLRAEDAAGEFFNLVGFQTHLKQGEQRRVFRMIPGLENARFERYGSMHRNTFVNGPEVLDAGFRLKAFPNVLIAGQLSGVEGYVESAASGLIAALSIVHDLGKHPLPETTMVGGLSRYVSGHAGKFQPSNAIFAMVPPSDVKIRGGGRRARREFLSERALKDLEVYLQALQESDIAE